jgi:hypothetical protein
VTTALVIYVLTFIQITTLDDGTDISDIILKVLCNAYGTTPVIGA